MFQWQNWKIKEISQKAEQKDNEMDNRKDRKREIPNIQGANVTYMHTQRQVGNSCTQKKIEEKKC